MTTDPLAAAIDHIRSITPRHNPWTAYEVSSFSPWEPDESDYAIATILNAVVSGQLISRDEMLAQVRRGEVFATAITTLADELEAERTRAEKAEAERDTAWNDAIEAAKGCVDGNHPFSIMDEMDLLRKGDSHNQQDERDQTLARLAAHAASQPMEAEIIRLREALGRIAWLRAADHVYDDDTEAPQ